MITQNLEKSLHFMRQPDGTKKYAALLALQAFLRECPHMSLDKIMSDFEPIWSAIRDKKSNVREVALEFINDYIKEISQRETVNCMAFFCFQTPF
jgi:hypothetical protein